jgi:hypothetical protein
MANPTLNFKSSGRIPFDVGGWVGLKKLLGQEFIDRATSSKSVYIIRLRRPFAIWYYDGVSPVVYIGRGDFKARVSNHIKLWIKKIGKSLNGASFEILVSTPKTNNNVDFYKHVEADLISEFEDRYGVKPLNNSKREYSSGRHSYKEAEIRKAFGLGKGGGYHWAIWPISSNSLMQRSDK